MPELHGRVNGSAETAAAIQVAACALLELPQTTNAGL